MFEFKRNPTLKVNRSKSIRSDHPLAVFVFLEKPVLRAAGGDVSADLLAQAKADGFTGKLGATWVVRPPRKHPAGKVVLVGLGLRADSTVTTLRQASAALARFAHEAGWSAVQLVIPDHRLPLSREEMIDSVPFKAPGSVGLVDRVAPVDSPTPLSIHPLQTIAEGLALGSYRFERFKSTPAPVLDVAWTCVGTMESEGAEALKYGLILAQAANFARDLINHPPSDKTPEQLGRMARRLAGPVVTVRVLRAAELKRLGARALLAVNRGSAHPPVLVHLHYRPRKKALGSVAFVGKGVTFDSGGLSLKPADGMMTMKYDMAGAATVFALFHALPSLNIPWEVHGVAVLTENMPGPDAYKPGDVVKAMNGKTIEILNTDAEGRVILADALTYAGKLKTSVVVDVATLTGAATVALGKAYAAVMSDTPGLERALRGAGEEAGERLWPLPLEKSYRDHIQSKVADWKNIGNPGEAGTIVGGLFLQQFIGKSPWAHVDMASVGWSSAGTALSPPGATGVMVRTLLTYLLRACRKTP